MFFLHEGCILIKRVAAIGGDLVQHGSQTLIVPEQHIYVLGDNGEASIDSQTWVEPYIHADEIIAWWVGS